MSGPFLHPRIKGSFADKPSQKKKKVKTEDGVERVETPEERAKRKAEKAAKKAAKAGGAAA